MFKKMFATAVLAMGLFSMVSAAHADIPGGGGRVRPGPVFELAENVGGDHRFCLEVVVEGTEGTCFREVHNDGSVDDNDLGPRDLGHGVTVRETSARSGYSPSRSRRWVTSPSFSGGMRSR